MARGIAKEVAGFPKESGNASPFYRVKGWKKRNDLGRIVKCVSKDPDAHIVVLRKKGRLIDVDIDENQMFFCPEKEFLGTISD
jgi:hypothetical protein